MPRHFIALDSLRGLAAIMVALYHFRTQSVFESSAVIRNAWLFVDFFFVLSGFVIASTYQKRLSSGYPIGAFMLLRLGRLYPLHVVVLMAYLATEIAIAFAGSLPGASQRQAFTGQTEPWALLTNLALLSGMGVHQGLTWNGVAWSISTEFWAYLVFAAAAASLGRSAAAVGLLIGALGAVLVFAYLGDTAGLARFIEFGRCLYGFGIGCLVWHLFATFEAGRRREPWAFWPATLAEVAACALAAIYCFNLEQLPQHILTPLVFAPAVFAFAHDRGALSRGLQLRIFTLVGMMSYSIYMIHPFVQARVMLPVALIIQNRLGLELVHSKMFEGAPVLHWGGADLPEIGAVLIMLAVVVTASFLTYSLIEAPGRRAMRSFVEARLQPARKVVSP